MAPVTVLFAAADPYSYDPNLHDGEWDPRLGLDEDLRAITQKVRAAEHRHAIVFKQCPAARPDDLLQALNEVRPQVVHFSGHGDAGTLVLVGAGGGPHPVSADALVRLFRAAGGGVRLVVLSACNSAPVARALAQVVDCAVGMDGEMPDESALAFNAAFYRALAFGRSVREAFEQGKAAVALEALEGAERPQLFVAERIDPARVVLVTEPGPGERRDGSQSVNVKGNNNQVFVAGGNLHASPGGPPPADGVRRFTNVWYLPRRLRFYQRINADVGTLMVYDDRVEFRGEKGGFAITDIHDVEHTRHGGDISNSWVRVTYGNPSALREAYFSHRTRLGLDALLGSSDELFAVLHQRIRPARTG